MESNLQHLLMNAHKEEMVTYVKNHPEDFTELIKLAITDKQPFSWRAAWLLWSCMDKNDSRIKKYLNQIITILPSLKENHQRELIKILLKMELPEKYESFLFDHCSEKWINIHHVPSIRFNAFKMLIKIAEHHPALMDEIKILTQDQYMETLSPTPQKSIRKMVSRFSNS